ncbi:MAG: T9SS type A sorting domain-containing protein [Candidatus Latescibacteria bacterium]|nr:T9SS type A sorting domain-containing protein [Candidatus Latescibacterota bacterium]
MNNFNGIPNSLRAISIWRFLRVFAVVTIIWVVYSISAEAYSLSQAFVWLKDRFLEITWEAPKKECDHFRIEISKTDLMAEPVVTSLSYVFTDKSNYQLELQDDFSYMFRVQGVGTYGALSDFSDSTSYFVFEGGEIAKQITQQDSPPVEFALSQNYPNPFNSQTTIEYQISDMGIDASGAEVNLTIYNTLGQRVVELVKEHQPAGKHHVIWDGCDSFGRQVASGNYIYLLVAGKFKSSKKMVYMK